MSEPSSSPNPVIGVVTGVWALRAVWVAVPVVAGPAFTEALDGRSLSVQLTAAAILWGGWFLGLIATLIPRAESLTAIRILAPAAPLAAAWAWLTDAEGVTAMMALTATVLGAALAMSPLVGDLFVNGSSYGDERRMALRPPGPLLAGPIAVAWAIVATGIVAGPLLLAARSWVLGGVAVVVGLPAAALAARAVHGLARRWVVFVPAGFVLHDPLTLVEPVLFPRTMVTALGPARVDTEATDLTQGAPGLVLQLDLAEPSRMSRLRPRRQPELLETGSLLFTPTRPGAVLDEADRRRVVRG
ncbi:MAG: hypothetical protein GY929_06900 [Actinomycetia bacterium]|nr:hypothetical protein [Actinomycetes bacterium]